MGKRGVRKNSAQGTNTVSTAPFLKDFSVLRHVQKQTDNRFFWPSRPDFLPSKHPSTESSAGLASGKARQLLIQQAYRRFRPVGDAQATLPPPESITYSLAPLYTSIAKMEVDPAWTHFVAHIGDLSKGSVSPLASTLFDALFWLVAKENFSSTPRHEEVFGRVEILLLYASSQANYGLTRLQLHRAVYIWTSLWEQYEVKGLPFTQVQFAETVASRLNNLDSRLASRVFSRMINACNTPEGVDEVAGKIKSWLKEGRCEITRRETWTSSSRNEMVNDDAYFRGEDRGVLEDRVWDELLQRCFHIGTSAQTTHAGMLALQQAQLDPSLDCVSQYLAGLSLRQLYNMLPADVKQGATALADAPKIPPLKSNSALDGRDDGLLKEETKRELVYAVAFVLATRKHYQAALYLFEREKDKNRDKGKRTDCSMKKVETYTAAANACARLVLPVDYGAKYKTEDARWKLTQLRRGLSLFVHCEWYESRSRNATAKILIEAILRCSMLDKTEAAVQSTAQWLLLLRQFTTVLLSHDPNLDTLQIQEDVTAYARLVKLHVDLRDYPFVKRLFLIKNRHEDQREAFLSHDDFLWLFEQSLEKEKDARFAKQLFLFWTGHGEGESEAADIDVPRIPPSLLRMFFWKLKKSGKEGSAIRMLHDTLDSRYLSGNNKIHPGHAIRMMRTFFMVGSDAIELSLSMADDLLRHWMVRRKQQQSTLLVLYSIALKGSIRSIDESDALLRSSILALFASFREHFTGLHKFLIISLARARKEEILTAYSCALEVLLEEKQARPTRSVAEEWIRELGREWGFKELGSQLWSLRIRAHLVGSDADVEQARVLFAQAVSLLDARNSLEGGQQVLSPSVTSMLMIALAERGHYKDALEYASIYQNHAGPLSPISKAFIEGARIAILHMRGNTEEALQKLNYLQKAGTGRERRRDSRLLKIIGKITARLEEQIKSEEVENRWKPRHEYNLPNVLNEEEQERARVYGAMASGQPWGRRREGQ